jgi:hypothetical protein
VFILLPLDNGRKRWQEQATTLFEGKRGPKANAGHNEPERLYSGIGKLKVDLDWLKKVRDQPAMIRQGWSLNYS